MNDTQPEVERNFREMIMSRTTPSERLAMASRMFAAAKFVAIAGIRMQYGDLSNVVIRKHLFLRWYGGDFTPEQREAILRSLDEKASERER